MSDIEKSFKWSDFPTLNNSTDLMNYLNKRWRTHTQYCHYTSIEAVNSILGGQSFLLGCVDRFNDKEDRKQFGDVRNQRHNYALCFSTGVNENLSLWYLYSGVEGKGARIRWGKNTFNKWIENAKYTLETMDGAGKIYDTLPLLEGKTMKRQVQDVLYSRVKPSQSGQELSVDLKYNTMTNHNFPGVELDAYKMKNNGFNKSLVWYYEKETRILVTLQGKALQYVDELHDHPEKQLRCVVKMDIDDNTYKNMNIDFAPEICSLDEVFHLESDKKWLGLRKFLYHSSHLNLSEYAGTVTMSLCSKCQYKKNKA